MACCTIALLLLLMCFFITLSPAAGSPTSRVPCNLFTTGGNLRKALKQNLHPRQVSALFIMALLLSGDVHCNPGPQNQHKNIYPCGLCERNVSWTEAAVACDDCSIWYHKSCIELCSSDFSVLNRSSVQWICHKCDSINCNSFTFQSISLQTSNFYAPLSDNDSNIDSFHSVRHFSPLRTSSPKNAATRSPKGVDPNNVLSRAAGTESSGTFPPPPTDSQTHRLTDNHSSQVYNIPKKQNLRILNVNCQSVTNKRAEFIAMAKFVKPDVIFGTESWLRPETSSSEVFPDDYVAYRKDRGSLGGGVFILVHKTLVSTVLPELDAECEAIWVKLHLRANKDLILGCFYMPHRSHADLQELDKTLKMITEGRTQKQVILAGDFNCPDISWETGAVRPVAPDRLIQQELIDMAAASQLTQIHNQPTRQDNIIDLVFVSNPSLVKHSTSIPGFSDHEAVVTDLDTQPHRVKEKPRKSYLYSKAKWEEIERDLEPLADKMTAMKEEGSNVNSMWEAFKASIMSAAEKHVPSVLRRNKSDLPWIDRGIRKLLKR